MSLDPWAMFHENDPANRTRTARNADLLLKNLRIFGLLNEEDCRSPLAGWDWSNPAYEKIFKRSSRWRLLSQTHFNVYKRSARGVGAGEQRHYWGEKARKGLDFTISIGPKSVNTEANFRTAQDAFGIVRFRSKRLFARVIQPHVRRDFIEHLERGDLALHGK